MRPGVALEYREHGFPNNEATINLQTVNAVVSPASGNVALALPAVSSLDRSAPLPSTNLAPANFKCLSDRQDFPSVGESRPPSGERTFRPAKETAEPESG